MYITLKQDEYEALVYQSRKGMAGQDQLPLDNMLKQVEERNGVRRYLLWVQWQDAQAVVPIGAEFPRKWPAELRTLIEQINVPINRQQVESTVAHLCSHPVSILVTPDPNATLGWSTLDQYFEVRP